MAARGALPLARAMARPPPRVRTTSTRSCTTPKQAAAPKQATPKQASATSRFYRTFTRPVAKALLLAVFTYQVVYWAWARLEADEARAETDATIAELEAQVGAYQKARAKQAGQGSTTAS